MNDMLDNEVLKTLLAERNLAPKYRHEAKLIRMTPKLADMLLKHNDINRPMNLSALYKMCQEIQRGHWKLNGETIIVSAAGRLLTGQHRCKAVVETGTAVLTWIVYGVDESAFDTVDQGRKKTAGDILSIGGEKHASLAASVGRWLRVIDDHGVHYNASISPQEIEESLSKHPESRIWIDRSAASSVRRLLSASVIAAFCAGSEKYGEKVVLPMYEKVTTGAQLEHGEAAWLLRERLVEQSMHKRAAQVIVCAMAIKAIHTYCTGKKRAILRWRTDEAWPEL